MGSSAYLGFTNFFKLQMLEGTEIVFCSVPYITQVVIKNTLPIIHFYTFYISCG